MHTRTIVLISAAIGVAAGGAGWLITRRRTEPVGVTPAHIGEPFPTVTGRLLSGEMLTVPDDLAGRVGLLVVAWDYAARDAVESWEQTLRASYGMMPDVRLLAVAMISGVGPLTRRFIDMAMARATPAGEQQTVLTVYGDLRALRCRLAAPPPEQASVFLLGRTGRIAWRTDGPSAPAVLSALDDALTAQGVGPPGA